MSFNNFPLNRQTCFPHRALLGLPDAHRFREGGRHAVGGAQTFGPGWKVAGYRTSPKWLKYVEWPEYVGIWCGGIICFTFFHICFVLMYYSSRQIVLQFIAIPGIH
jgi:hypothetical protein